MLAGIRNNHPIKVTTDERLSEKEELSAQTHLEAQVELIREGGGAGLSREGKWEELGQKHFR